MLEVPMVVSNWPVHLDPGWQDSGPRLGAIRQPVDQCRGWLRAGAVNNWRSSRSSTKGSLRGTPSKFLHASIDTRASIS